MFRRRHKRGFLHRMRGMVWPHIGWRRAGSYVMHRLRRLPGTPHNVATGFACGAAISFTPFVGLHFVIAGLLAWAVGGNVFAAAVGTVVGNPWTFPFIWLGVYQLGCLLIGWDIGDTLSEGLTLTYILDHPFAVLVPMAVGSIPVGVVAWLAFYWPVRRLVADYQELRRRRRVKRLRAHGTASRKLARFRPSARKEGSV
ncbi:MAG: DUF2062 domain-containing protein [Alphaproteobacteria bacterium]